MTTDQPPTGLYSPDGKYRWDGATWQPVEQAAAGQPQAPPQWGAPTQQGNAPAPPWGAPAQQANPPAQPGGAPPLQGWAPRGAPPRKGPHTVLMVGLVAVVALVLGIGTGWFVGTARSVAGAGPSAPPPIPEEFPGNDERYLQGVTGSRVTQEWQDTGPSWTCEPAEPPSSGGEQATRCTVGADVGNAFTLNIIHDGETQVRELNVSCRARPDAQVCSDMFAWLAGSALNGQPEQQEAAGWAAENFASDLSTTIGRVHLQVRLEPHTIFVMPAP